MTGCDQLLIEYGRRKIWARQSVKAHVCSKTVDEEAIIAIKRAAKGRAAEAMLQSAICES